VLHGLRGLYFPQFGGKINPGLYRGTLQGLHLPARIFRIVRE